MMRTREDTEAQSVTWYTRPIPMRLLTIVEERGRHCLLRWRTSSLRNSVASPRKWTAILPSHSLGGLGLRFARSVGAHRVLRNSLYIGAKITHVSFVRSVGAHWILRNSLCTGATASNVSYAWWLSSCPSSCHVTASLSHGRNLSLRRGITTCAPSLFAPDQLGDAKC